MLAEFFKNSSLKIAIMGGTGAVGRLILEQAIECDAIETITMIIRRVLPDWDDEKERNLKFKEKVKYLMI